MDRLSDIYSQKPRLKRVAFWVLAYTLLAVGLGGYTVAFVLAPDIANPRILQNLDNFSKYSIRFYYILLRIGLSWSFAFLLAGSLLILNNKPWAKTVVHFGIWPCIILAVAIVVLTFIYGVSGLEFSFTVVNYSIGSVIFAFAFIILRTINRYR
jgi:hypothetical protein